MKAIKEFTAKYRDYAIFAFRIIFGGLILTHGLQKFSIGSTMVFSKLPALLQVAGVVETVTGALVVLGLFTRWAAFVEAGEMAVAYWTMHAFGAFGKGAPWFNPLLNNGEPAVLYCFGFLLLFFLGGGKWALDSVVCKDKKA